MRTPTELARLLHEQARRLEALDTRDVHLVDDLVRYDLDKAYRVLAADVDRTLADAARRFEAGLMVPPPAGK